MVINMIVMITYCRNRNIKTAAAYLAHALFNSAKGLRRLPIRPLPLSAGYSGNVILRHAQTLLHLLVNNLLVDNLLASILTLMYVKTTDIVDCFPTVLISDSDITLRSEVQRDLFLDVSS